MKFVILLAVVVAVLWLRARPAPPRRRPARQRKPRGARADGGLRALRHAPAARRGACRGGRLFCSEHHRAEHERATARPLARDRNASGARHERRRRSAGDAAATASGVPRAASRAAGTAGRIVVRRRRHGCRHAVARSSLARRCRLALRGGLGRRRGRGRRLAFPGASGAAHRRRRTDGVRAHVPRLRVGARGARADADRSRSACRASSASGRGLGVLADLPRLCALSISMWLLPRFQRPAAPQTMARLRSPPVWLATIGVDVLVLHRAARCWRPSAGLNFAALLVLPVLMAGVLTPRLMALATAAGDHARAARRGLAQRARRRRRRGADDAGRAGRQRACS